MCGPIAAAAVMAVGSATQSAMQYKDAAKAEGKRADAARLQAQEYVKANNITQANLNLSNRDAYENAVSKMTSANMQGIQNMGALNTAIAESGIKGNSINRLRRSQEASNSAEQLSITNEYKRNYAEIFGKQLESQQNTISAVSGLDQDAHKTSGLQQALGITMAGAQGAAQGYSMGSAMSGAMSGGASSAGASAGTSAGASAASTSTGTAVQNYGYSNAGQLSTNFSTYTR
ncbi:MULTISPECIES: virion core protein, T7 gp14 family [Klebsiella pneumoniae complex]|nr:hypothetical protein [Klebsiella variicola]KAA0474878.1 hypothetical protein F0331_01070 [Klebsiella variicola]HBQ5120503.1 hypothetical protein [Klebsiella variicola]HEK5019264.1 hypothetical protein [Klebsiella variicola]